jgi:hypothetical protein
VGAVVPAAYGVAVAVSTVAGVLRHRDAAGWLMLVAYPVMHLGWGSGFLVGRANDSGTKVPSLDP